MDHLRLVIPDMSHQAALEDLLAEWTATGTDISPGTIDKHDQDYAAWLQETLATQQRETCPAHLVPAHTYTYFLMNDEDELLGAINIRHELNDYLRQFGGHIGYGIRPSQRRKGYAKVQLQLGLEKCTALGIDRVLITCNDNNPASAATILSCGGILEDIRAEESGNLVRCYWIDL